MSERSPLSVSAIENFSVLVKRATGVETYNRELQEGKTRTGALVDGAFTFMFPIFGENFRRLKAHHEGKINYILGESWAGVGLQMLLDVGVTVGTVTMALNNSIGEGIAMRAAYNTAVAWVSTRIKP